jgi:DNA mismatch endonuclease (patch repair protein)
MLKQGRFVGVSPGRSRQMGAVRGKGNFTTEVRARAMLVRAGLQGWCMHPSDVDGRPDFYFSAERLALFLDGCFWHGCRRCGHVPRTNSRFWAAKIERNQERDRAVGRALRAQGIRVLRIWEHAARERGWLDRLRRHITKRGRRSLPGTERTGVRSPSPTARVLAHRATRDWRK